VTRPKKRYPPNNVTAKRKACKDCAAEGITTKRKAPHPGPRCNTHNRLVKARRRSDSRESRWLTIYGITAEEYNAIKEFQGGVCALCRRANGARKALSVDHDHVTGVVRGALCLPCNRNVLGHARDSIEFFERCIEYLQYPPAVQVIGERIAPIEMANLTLNGDA
jgi:hypothetical protein